MMAVLLSTILSMIFVSGVTSGQLYLQPSKPQHGYFTEDKFFITCLTADNTVDQLKWIGNDESDIVTSTGRIHVQPEMTGQQGLQLVVESVQKEDAGKYVCSDVQNSISFDLVVYKSINFGSTPKVQHTEEFKTARIECHVSRDPSPNFSWEFKGTKLFNSSKYIVDGHTLTVINASRHDAGKYVCMAFLYEPLASQIKYIDIDFEVHYAPEWVESNSNAVYASVGTKAILSCEASAYPAPQFQWLKNGETIDNSSEYTISSNQSVTSLHVMVRDEEKYGVYTCRASNSLGWIENLVTLKEGVVPDSPPSLEIVKEESGILTLALKAEADLPDEELAVTGFRVQYKLGSEEWDGAEIVEFHKDDLFQLKNMSYNSVYVLRAAARNAAGYSDYSDPIEYTTKGLEVAPVISDGAFRFDVSKYTLILCGLFAVYSLWLARK